MNIAWERRYSIVLLVVLTAIPFVPMLLAGHTIGDWAQIAAFLPWRGSLPPATRPWDVLQADGMLQFYVWRDLVFEGWRNGGPTFWNPYALGGTPLLANSQSGVLYPLHVLMGVLQVPTNVAVVLLAWLHLAIAALGARFLALKLGASEAGAVLAGIGVGYSAFLLSWAPLASVGTTSAWIPWALGFVYACFASADRRAAYKAGAGLAGSIAMMLLGGHLQFAAYGLLAIKLVGIWLLGALLLKKLQGSNLWRSLGAAIAGGFAGVLLAAPQILAVLSYSEFSHRRGSPTAEGFAAYSASAIQPYELLGLIFPNLLGLPGTAFQLAENTRLTGFWPAYAKIGANFAECALGIGPLALALLFLLRRRLDWARIGGVALIGVVGLLMATGTPLNALLYFGVPGWSATGSPGRAAILFVLAACVVAGTALPKGDDKLDLRIPLGALLVALIASFVGMISGTSGIRPWLPDGTVDLQKLISIAFLEAAPMAVLSAIAAGLAIVLFSKRMETPAILAAAASSILVLGTQIVPSGDPTPVRAISAALSPGPQERVAFVNEPWDLLQAAPAVVPPNLATYLRIHEAGGYDSLLHRDTVSWLADVNGRDAAPEANGNIMYVKPGFDAEKLKASGVTWVVSPKELPDLGVPGEPFNDPNGNAVLYSYRIGGHGRFLASNGEVRVIRETPNTIELEVQSRGPGTLTVFDRNMPGWLATIGPSGPPRPIAGQLWREFVLPNEPGTIPIRMEYVPPGWQLGWLFAACGAVVMACLLLGGWSKLGDLGHKNPSGEAKPSPEPKEPSDPS